MAMQKKIAVRSGLTLLCNTNYTFYSLYFLFRTLSGPDLLDHHNPPPPSMCVEIPQVGRNNKWVPNDVYHVIPVILCEAKMSVVNIILLWQINKNLWELSCHHSAELSFYAIYFSKLKSQFMNQFGRFERTLSRRISVWGLGLCWHPTNRIQCNSMPTV